MKYLVFIIYLFILSAFTGVLSQKSEYNWDFIPYVALELKLDGQNETNQHKLAYQELKTHMPEKIKTHINPNTDQKKFRNHMYTNPKAFQELLSLYDIKPFYVLTCYAFYKLGSPLIESTVFPSLLGYFGLGLLFFFWISRYTPWWLALVLCTFLLGTDSLVDGARYSNPDCYGAFLTILGFYLLIERKKWWLALFFLGLAILTRPDAIILVGFVFMGIALFIKHRFQVNYISIVLSFVFIVGCYLLPKLWTLNPGYRVLFVHTFYEYFLFPVSQNRSVTLGEYFFILKSHAFHLFKEPLIIYVFFALACVVLARRNEFSLFSLKLEDVLIFSILAAFLFRFIIYPFMWPGYWLAYYYLLAILSIKILSKNNRMNFIRK